MNIRRCEYVKTDGQLCGSPALKTRRYCYFHYEVNRTVAHLDIPPLEDGDAIQLALTDLARAVAEDRISLKPAALLAYILQTASANLKRVSIGLFTDRMITELPALDPYSRGLAPLPGERNRDPEHAHSAPLKPALSGDEGAPSGPAPEGRSKIAQGVSPGRGNDEGIRTALPTAGAQVAEATAAPKPTPSPDIAPRLQHRIDAAKAGSLKDARALLGMLKNVG